MNQAILHAAAWPIYDVPKIFEISSKGIEPALPGIIGLGLLVALPVFNLPASKKGWRWVDIVLGYGLAAGVSFVFAMRK